MIKPVELNWASARKFLKPGDVVWLKTKKDYFELVKDCFENHLGHSRFETYFRNGETKVFPEGNTLLIIDMDIKTKEEV